MSKGLKIWLIVAVSLILLGIIVFGGAMAMLGWNFANLSTHKYEENTYRINENFNSISVDAEIADVVFMPSSDETGTVVCHERKNLGYTVEVKDGVLTVKLNDTRKWYDHIGIGFESPKIKVYIPEGEYVNASVRTDTGDVRIQSDFRFESVDVKTSTGNISIYASASKIVSLGASTGNINVRDITSGGLELSVTTGDIELSGVTCTGDINIRVTTGDVEAKNVKCVNFTSSGDTGEMELEGVIASGKMDIERSTGDIEFNGCDAAEIYILTDTGDVEGSLLTEKVFIARSDTGRVRVPETLSGGMCKITTDTGDIRISVRQN